MNAHMNFLLLFLLFSFHFFFFFVVFDSDYIISTRITPLPFFFVSKDEVADNVIYSFFSHHN